MERARPQVPPSAASRVTQCLSRLGRLPPTPAPPPATWRSRGSAHSRPSIPQAGRALITSSRACSCLRKQAACFCWVASVFLPYPGKTLGAARKGSREEKEMRAQEVQAQRALSLPHGLGMTLVALTGSRHQRPLEHLERCQRVPLGLTSQLTKEDSVPWVYVTTLMHNSN